MRKLSWVLAGSVVLMPVATIAAGLGEATVKSYLSQPLVAEIPIEDVSADQLENITIQLADRQLHEEVGINWTNVKGNLSFEIVQGETGPVVQVTSRRAIREPILSFLLELRWNSTAIVREYNLLLDPPDTKPAEILKTQREVPAAPPVRVQYPPIEMAGSYGPIPRGMTLSQIAREARRGTGLSQAQMIQAIVDANPSAFINGDPNWMLAGATLSP